MAHEPVKFSVKLTDTSGQWFNHQLERIDKALATMGNSILADSRMIAPKKSGGMRELAKVVKGHRAVAVVYPGPYAGYQERGAREDGSHVARNYTTHGTGKHYLETTGKRNIEKGIKWFLSHS